MAQGTHGGLRFGPSRPILWGMSADVPASPFSLARRIQDAVDELNGACAAAAPAGLTVELDVLTEARIGMRPDCPLVSATVTRVERIVPEVRQ